MYLIFFSGFRMGFFVLPSAVEGKISYANLIAQRFLKFVPALGFLICFEFLWPMIGDGPLWSFEADDVNADCSKSWWTNLLFISKTNFQRGALLITLIFLSNSELESSA